MNVKYVILCQFVCGGVWVYLILCKNSLTYPMRFILIFILSVLLYCSCDRKPIQFASPDQNIQIAFSLDEKGVPTYQIIYKGDTLINPSRLGVKVQDNPMDSALQLISSEVVYNKKPFNFALNEFYQEEDPYNEMVVKVKKNGQEMDIIFRAYNEGVAIRYWLRGYENIVISGDMVEVRFRENVKSFWAPEHTPHEKNSYYRSPLSTIQAAYRDARKEEYKYGAYPDSIYLALPFLVDNGHGKYLNFQQVYNYDANAFAFRLNPVDYTVYSSVMKEGCAKQVLTLPYYSQWIAIGISDSSEKLLESKMVYHLGIEEEVPDEPEKHPIRLFENNCYNNVILPFSRHYEGIKEYPLINIEHGAHSTLMHQLALHVVFNRPISVYNDYKGTVDDQKMAAYNFVRELPSEWSEMNVVAGELGKYVVVARKDAHSDNWFVGGITDGSARELNISFDFLDKEKLYKGFFYEDTEDADWLERPNNYKMEEVFVRKGNTFSFSMGYGGGFALILKEVKNP
ncbi:MAG: glycoside hydrolase family 97 N-terminal domain-containing protein [Bacteroidales bacterium]